MWPNMQFLPALSHLLNESFIENFNFSTVSVQWTYHLNLYLTNVTNFGHLSAEYREFLFLEKLNER